MYLSTRGCKPITAASAIMQGIAGDGGLFVPEQLNDLQFSGQEQRNDYHHVMRKIWAVFLDGMNQEAIEQLICESYQPTSFGAVPVRIESLRTFDMLTLWHGPTFAFKDMALSVLPKMMRIAKRSLGITSKTIVLSATSGDTGSATLDGFNGEEDTDVIVLYPYGLVSPFQEKQMQSYCSAKNHVIAVKGNFDDCQRIAKEAFQAIKPKHAHLTSANSINIGRIIAQIVYYVYAYHVLVHDKRQSVGEPMDIVVPTGNFGNILSGYYAAKLGIPIATFLVASNQNDVLVEFFKTKKYNATRPFHKTVSPSMDILVSSNLERLIYEAADSDSSYVKAKMDELRTTGSFEVEDEIMRHLSMFKAESVNEKETRDTIREIFETEHVLIDPHTAVAVKALMKYKEGNNSLNHPLVISTASPFKFADTVLQALGERSTNDPLADIIRLENRTGIKADVRMKKFLSETHIPFVLTKEETLPYLRRLVGDLDV